MHSIKWLINQLKVKHSLCCSLQGFAGSSFLLDCMSWNTYNITVIWWLKTSEFCPRGLLCFCRMELLSIMPMEFLGLFIMWVVISSYLARLLTDCFLFLCRLIDIPSFWCRPRKVEHLEHLWTMIQLVKLWMVCNTCFYCYHAIATVVVIIIFVFFIYKWTRQYFHGFLFINIPISFCRNLCFKLRALKQSIWSNGSWVHGPS